MKQKLGIAALMAASFVGGKVIQLPQTFSSAVEPQISLLATVIGIHDGDTITVETKYKINVRFLNCYSKELSESGGVEAKQNLEKYCHIGQEVLVQAPIKQDMSKMFTFGRVLANVYADGINLADQQVKDGHGTIKKEK